jgi:hypothetical protein
VIYKINGRKVSQKEWDKYSQDRQAITGNLMDEMLSAQQAPRVMTDDVALSGKGNLDQQFKNPKDLEHICGEAMKHGYKPKPSDFYNAALARFAGDPQAFLNHGQGVGHVKRTLEERGYVCPGGIADDGSMVKVQTRTPDEDPYQKPKLKLHPRIVRREKKHLLKQNPDLANKKDLEEAIIDRHGWNPDR